MASYTNAEVRDKLRTIRDAILDDMATNTGPKMRLTSYSVAGRNFTYSNPKERVEALAEVNKMIEQFGDTGGLQLARASSI